VRSGFPQNGQGVSGSVIALGLPEWTTQIFAQRSEHPVSALNSAIARI
jgi:hypothetical protein